MKLLTQFSPEPIVHLVNSFNQPYDNSVATARTCYSSKVIYAEDVNKDEATKIRRDIIAKSIYQAGHHTTLQHATFQFAIEKVSRQCIWSFLHSHPFYNSEQVSQRYVQVAASNFSLPSLPEESQELYSNTISMMMEAYGKLQILLRPTVEKEYLKNYPSRNISDKRWRSSIQKKCQEVARYVLPLATHAHLYHTISGVTLLRYRRMANVFDAPLEQSLLVKKMIQEVEKWDPEFFKNAEDPIPLEETPEFQLIQDQNRQDFENNAQHFVREFDRSLGNVTSLMVDYKIRSEKVMADSVRNILGLLEHQMEDAAAIDLVMNPSKNAYLSETLNLSHHSKLSRAMIHPHFTFRKKISHTADSQDQRHRTVPGARPILSKQFSLTPDYIIPVLIQRTPLALEYYKKVMNDLWKNIERLMNQNAEVESVMYLLPNAFPIRFEESGSLLDFHHKWVHRMCYTAQEEIWKNSVEEVEQVEKIFPLLGKYLRAPCKLRQIAGRIPYCPEGDRFCGVPVWEKELEQYSRVL